MGETVRHIVCHCGRTFLTDRGLADHRRHMHQHETELARVLRWCVEHDGETLFDNPKALAAARAILAKIS